MTSVGVINLGLGNIASVARMLAWLEIPAEVVADPGSIDSYSHLILPGVGHYTDGSSRLTDKWRAAIAARTDTGIPLLGICLGMQLLCEGSDEGEGRGLGYFAIHFERLPRKPGFRVPHMGWDTVTAAADSRLFRDLDEPRFYFVHSYYARGDDESCTAAADYGVPIAAALEDRNICGVQFHPEKSHRFGMQLLRNFTGLYPA